MSVQRVGCVILAQCGYSHPFQFQYSPCEDISGLAGTARNAAGPRQYGGVESSYAIFRNILRSWRILGHGSSSFRVRIKARARDGVGVRVWVRTGARVRVRVRVRVQG